MRILNVNISRFVWTSASSSIVHVFFFVAVSWDHVACDISMINGVWSAVTEFCFHDKEATLESSRSKIIGASRLIPASQGRNAIDELKSLKSFASLLAKVMLRPKFVLTPAICRVDNVCKRNGRWSPVNAMTWLWIKRAENRSSRTTSGAIPLDVRWNARFRTLSISTYLGNAIFGLAVNASTDFIRDVGLDKLSNILSARLRSASLAEISGRVNRCHQLAFPLFLLYSMVKVAVSNDCVFANSRMGIARAPAMGVIELKEQASVATNDVVRFEALRGFHVWHTYIDEDENGMAWAQTRCYA